MPIGLVPTAGGPDVLPNPVPAPDPQPPKPDPTPEPTPVPPVPEPAPAFFGARSRPSQPQQPTTRFSWKSVEIASSSEQLFLAEGEAQQVVVPGRQRYSSM